MILLRDRDREQLRESFASTNTAIDNLRQQYQEHIISDIDLRDCLRNEGKQLLMEMLETYYNKFTNNDI
ncbi:unnamed protein product [Adineta steineri]|uniref:Exocyst complex subunit Exo70 C-terminal domain-containing protein n=1 Tax=Adineta steineri TaxID=433720 RepID=A0A813SAE3_9BILA|nr:unnamed protein product [Adineta steineri]CAF3822887.1 unnamed protein product [Adineta steineri]